jgi:hypothetical protein
MKDILLPALACILTFLGGVGLTMWKLSGPSEPVSQASSVDPSAKDATPTRIPTAPVPATVTPVEYQSSSNKRQELEPVNICPTCGGPRRDRTPAAAPVANPEAGAR